MMRRLPWSEWPQSHDFGQPLLFFFRRQVLVPADHDVLVRRVAESRAQVDLLRKGVANVAPDCGRISKPGESRAQHLLRDATSGLDDLAVLRRHLALPSRVHPPPAAQLRAPK